MACSGLAKVANHESAFWFVTMISNPLRYRSRGNLYKKFRNHILNELNSNLLTVELMHGETCAHITKDHEPSDHEFPNPVNTIINVVKVSESEIVVQVRAESVLWHKENMLNLGFSHLPPSCKYVSWIDADITFVNKNIVEDTVHQLQFYKVVQMFQNCCDLGPNGEVMQLHTSFGYCHRQGYPASWNKANICDENKKQTKSSKSQNNGLYYYTVDAKSAYGCEYGSSQIPAMPAQAQLVHFHPGYAWAMKLETLNSLGGLLDTAILGAGDHHMSLCMIGKGEFSIPQGIHPNYAATIMRYQELCDRYVQKRLGYVNSLILHGFHGFKKHRKYVSRWQVLVKNQYDPLKDIKRNLHGVYEFTAPESDLAHEILDYFRSRNEDVIVDDEE